MLLGPMIHTLTCGMTAMPIVDFYYALEAKNDSKCLELILDGLNKSYQMLIPNRELELMKSNLA